LHRLGCLDKSVASLFRREREPPLADLNTVLKETTTETHEAVQELKGDLAGVKKQLGNQQKMITAMYRHKVKHEMPT
tara:strand:+ start:280 stop:510 length:231 start_codon:yes stop_codon:yes gene_type:complete